MFKEIKLLLKIEVKNFRLTFEYIWPKNSPSVKARVLGSLCLLVFAKVLLINVSVKLD